MDETTASGAYPYPGIAAFVMVVLAGLFYLLSPTLFAVGFWLVPAFSVVLALVVRRVFDWENAGEGGLTGRGSGVAIVSTSVGYTLLMIVSPVVPFFQPFASLPYGRQTLPTAVLWVALAVMFVVGILRLLDIEVRYLT